MYQAYYHLYFTIEDTEFWEITQIVWSYNVSNMADLTFVFITDSKLLNIMFYMPYVLISEKAVAQ